MQYIHMSSKTRKYETMWASQVALVVKNPFVNAGDIRDSDLIPGSVRSPGKATHFSILAWRIFMDRGAWWATVHSVAKSRTQLK